MTFTLSFYGLLLILSLFLFVGQTLTLKIIVLAVARNQLFYHTIVYSVDSVYQKFIMAIIL